MSTLTIKYTDFERRGDPPPKSHQKLHTRRNTSVKLETAFVTDTSGSVTPSFLGDHLIPIGSRPSPPKLQKPLGTIRDRSAGASKLRRPRTEPSRVVYYNFNSPSRTKKQRNNDRRPTSPPPPPPPQNKTVSETSGGRVVVGRR